MVNLRSARGLVALKFTLTKFQFVLVVGHCVDESNGTAGVPDGLLHEVYFRTDFLSLQLFDLFFPEVLML